MSAVLSGYVGARGAHVAPGQRLDEIAAGPLEYGASDEVDSAGGLGFRVPDEGNQASFGSKARDDVHMVHQDGHVMNVYLPPPCRVANRRQDAIGVSPPERSLTESRVPGDVHVQPERSMGHGALG